MLFWALPFRILCLIGQCMNTDELFRVAAGIVQEVKVCRLSSSVAKDIGATTEVVKLSNANLIHILRDHKDLTVSEFLLLPKAIQFGLLVWDRNALVACYQHPYIETRRYIAAVKLTAGKSELYVTTFHKSAKRQTRTILGRGRKIKNHD